MKKLVLTFVAMLMAGMSVSQAQPQQQGGDPMMQTVPNDPAVRVGVMPNGIKYYIRKNTRDPQRANFHIFYKVGAIQEQDHQNGLAHFLEHMAFNGSKNFKDNSMISYLESIGVRFGENLNAQTGQESTQYMVTNVPVVREGVLDSALLILHDWAGFISLNNDDIDDERGVIREELRQGRNAQRRVMDAQFPVLFNNSIYSQRNVIGTDSLLQSFKYQDIKDFYHTWYRPDVQSFVIVGDIDVDQVEKKLLAVMADIPARTDKVVIETPKIPSNQKMMVSIASDPESTSSQVQMLFRHEPLPFEMRDKFVGQYLNITNALISSMFNDRMADISQKPDAPFLNAGGEYTSLVNATDAFFCGATVRDGESLRAINAMYTELLRMQRGGFTQSELDRAKARMQQSLEQTYHNRDNVRNTAYANMYMANFERNAPYPTPEIALQLQGQLLSMINLGMVNQMAAQFIKDENSAVLVVSPKKEGVSVPTEAEVIAAVEAVKASTIEPYTENVVTEPLVSEQLKGAPVVKTEAGVMPESTVWTLKNGVKVVLKPTKFRGGEVSMEAFQRGGTSTISDLSELYSINLFGDFSTTSGIGKFSATDLNRMMAGKMASVTNTIGELSQGFKGVSSTKDFETLMQLTYLKYTQPRFDATEWSIFADQLKAMIPNIVSSPGYVYSDSLTNTVYGHDPRMALISEKTISMASKELMESAYRKLYSNAYDMTFVFVGDFDPQTIKPLVEKYLGSLPAKKAKIGWGKDLSSVAKGEVNNRFTFPLETPKVDATQINNGDFDYDLKNRLAANAMSYILDIRYIKSIREEKGGTYGVSVRMSIDKFPTPKFTMKIAFQTDASKIDELMPIVEKEINDMIADGVSEENLNKFKEFNLKKFDENRTDNAAWMHYLKSYYQSGDNFYDGYAERINSLTSNDIKDLAAKMFGKDNVIKVIMMPQAK